MNKLLNSMKQASNFTYTENQAITHKTTESKLLDMFAMGGSMRDRSVGDITLMFKNAYDENPVYALKCLFYLRDITQGQGERRFFRECIKWLAINHTEAARRNFEVIPDFGRYDDLYSFIGTPLEKEVFEFIKEQFELDLNCKTPSLLGKWLPSENASSKETKEKAKITIKYFGLTPRYYRNALSTLRSRINIVEKLMSQNRWEEIEFDKLPSKAGLIYRNAFARRDIIKEKFAKFVKDKNTKVNAATLYPYEIVEKALKVPALGCYGYNSAEAEINRAIVNKYWENLTEYFNGANLNALAVVDTSGSMHGTPINVAISLGLYCAERAGGPFANHYISFASRPQLIECEGIDFCDKVYRIYRTNLVDNTNIEAVFDLLLETAKRNKCSQFDLPQNILIISDMEFDEVNGGRHYDWHPGCCVNQGFKKDDAETVMEGIASKWAQYGYELPKLIFWNVDARQNNIPMLDNGRISYVSGFSPAIFKTIMSGKSGYELMMAKLDTFRYAPIS